jgi:ABC-type sugar transport system ATPase subunit
VNDTILSLRGVSKVYPGTVALHNVDLEIRRGETHGIIGKNGAGKSTLVGIVAGLVTPTAGELTINGHTYQDLSRIASRKESVSVVPQEPQLVQQCTVAENLFMPDYPLLPDRLRVDWQRMYRHAEEILKRSGLSVHARTVAGDLGIGMQQLILMLKASYVERSQVIILDEAFASLSEREEELFFSIMRERKATGVTMLHISHRIDELLEVCDRMTVLRDGCSVTTVRREDVNRESLSALIVGAPGTAPAARDGASAPSGSVAGSPGTPAIPVLSVRGLTSAESFQDISFDVGPDEILGIAGLIGSGRTEIMKSIIGMEPLDGGKITVDGGTIAPESPSEALRHGVVYLPEERDAEGLIESQSVRVNTVLSALKRLVKGLFIDRARETDMVRHLSQRLSVKYASMDQEVRELSGGNRQKVVVAKVLSTNPRVYLLDEPTKGIDISAKASLLDIIRNQLARGAGVVLTTPGLDDLLSISDRILVLHRGRIVAEHTGPDFDEEGIFHEMQGAKGT